MADRTVSVELTLKAQQYKAETIESRLETERLDQKVEALNRDLDKVPIIAAKAGFSLAAMGTEAELANRKLDDGRSSIKKFTDDFEGAAKKLDDSNRQGFLRKAFGLSGISQLAGEIAQRFKDLGLQAGDAFGQGFKGFLDAMPSEVKVVLVGALAGLVASMLASLLAALNGALLATTGLGGIGLLVAGQLQSPLIHSAISQLGHDVMNALGNVAAPFGGRLTFGLGVIDTGLQKLIGSLGPSLANLSNAIEPLAQGIAKMLVAIGPGLSQAFDAAMPILLQFAHILPEVGQSLSFLFSQLAHSSRGAGEGLQYLIVGIDFLIRFVGVAIRAFSDLFQAMVAFGDAGTAVLQKVFGWIPLLGDWIKKNHDLFHNLHQGADSAGTAVDNFDSALAGLNPTMSQTASIAERAAAQFQNLSKGLDAAFNRTMGVDQATLQLATSMSGLADSVQKNGTSLKENTKEGQANLGVIQQTISNINSMRDANIANGMSIDEANGKYRSQLDQLQATLIQLGFNKVAVRALIDEYRQIPGQVSTIVDVLGLDAATTKLVSVKQKLDDLNGRITTTYVVVDTVTGQQQTITHKQGYNRWGGIYEHAETGLLSAGIYSSASPARYAFAEPATGGEAFVPRFGDYGRSTAILDQAAHWYGGRFMSGLGGPQTLQLAATFVLPSGEVVHQQLITYALNTGRQPAQLFPASSR